MASLLPATLIGPDGKEVASSSLAGKILALYFSAHWCGPCRAFTPRLVEWFANFKKNHPRRSEMEIVFLSSDREEESWKEYFSEMTNFHALKYADRDAKNRLSAQFKVTGIPTLVFVDESGQTLTTNGRSIVTEDPEAADFPWKVKPLLEIVGTSFTNASGPVHGDLLKDKYVGFYFSAHWCPPCRLFTPELAKTYRKVVGEGKPFEVLYVSSDRQPGEYSEYLHTMPWLAVPYEDEKRRKALSRRFDISSLPTLVIVDPSGKVVTKDGRGALSEDPEGAEFPWVSRALNILSDSKVGAINDTPSLIIFTDGSQEQSEAAKKALTPLADAEEAAAKAAGRDTFDMFYMYPGESSDDVVDSLRSFAALPGSDPLIVLLDIPNQAKFVQKLSGAATSEQVTAFLAARADGSLRPLGLRDDFKE